MQLRCSSLGFLFAITLALCCQAASAGSMVYWTEIGAIKRSPTDQPAVETIITGSIQPYDISADGATCTGQIYWTDTYAKTVGRSNFNGSNVHVVATLSTPQGIAAHPGTQTVYWSISGAQESIYRANLDFSGATRVVDVADDPDVGIRRVRVAANKLYWSVQECPIIPDCNRAVFYRGDLDGTNQEILFILTNTWVTDFLVDSTQSKIYWTTRYQQGAPGGPPSPAMWRSNLDGTGVELLRVLSSALSCLAQEPLTGRLVWNETSGSSWQILIGDSIAQNPTVLVNGSGTGPWGLSVALNSPAVNDCNQNGIEDACELDCNNNQVPDDCDIATGFSEDCNSNGTPDECETNDCNQNSVPDDCDITSGTSLDCNGNGVPDECDLIGHDCNSNGIPDVCDIASGSATDCDGNTVPDACEVAAHDCNGNGVHDACDIAAGTSTDCDGNDVPDECEVAAHDCNGNGIHDACDILSGFSQDANGDGRPDECPFVLGTLLADPTGINKVRFISFSATGSSGETALRVNLTSLHHVSPPYTGQPTVAFTPFEGQSVWVGPPATFVESNASQIPFKSAKTQCTPFYHIWSTEGLIHVRGSAIVPSSIYKVENVAAVCEGYEDSPPCLSGGANVSAALSITTNRWGDTETYYSPYPGQPDFGDISAGVNKFRGVPGAPIKARVDIQSNDAFGNITDAALQVDAGFNYIAAVVDAFRGKAYPAKMGRCSGAGTAACTTAADCTTGGNTGPCYLNCVDYP